MGRIWQAPRCSCSEPESSPRGSPARGKGGCPLPGRPQDATGSGSVPATPSQLRLFPSHSRTLAGTAGCMTRHPLPPPAASWCCCMQGAFQGSEGKNQGVPSCRGWLTQRGGEEQSVNPLRDTDPSPELPATQISSEAREKTAKRRERERQGEREEKQDPEKTTYYSRSSRSVCQRRRLGAQKQKRRGYNRGAGAGAPPSQGTVRPAGLHAVLRRRKTCWG